MLTPAPTSQELVETLQSLIRYYAPNLQPSVATVAGGFGAVAVGLLIAFRSGQLARGLVCLVGLAVGAAAGHRIALSFGGPGPISAGIGAIMIGALAWKTYRIWLAVGSVAAITLSATAYQVAAKGDLPATLRGLQPGTSIPVPKLVTPAEQQQNLNQDPKELANKLWEKTSETMRGWGLQGWLWPALALVAGVILAVWALSVIAVMWLGLLGSVIAVCGALALIMMQSPQLQAEIVQRPQFVLGAIGVIWLFGLMWQAKSSRMAKPGGKPAAA